MPVVAAIDVGSNAMRLAIGRVEPGKPVEILKYTREPVRLGHDVFTTGALSPETIHRAARAFKHFRQEIDHYHCQRIRAVATSAVREAMNKGAFIQAMAVDAGIDVEVLPASEEARLVFLAVAAKLELHNSCVMLIDIGGGSVEIGLAAAGELVASRSLKLGTVRMLEIIAEKGLGEERFRHMVDTALSGLQAWIARSLPNLTIDFAIGTGGNVESLGDIAAAHFGRQHKGRLNLHQLQELIKRLESLSPTQRQRQLDLRPDRADVILPAAVVLHALMVTAKVQQLHIPRVGLKDGILLEMAATEPTEVDAPRHERVLSQARIIGRKYHYDETHGANVARFAAQLFTATRKFHQLSDEQRLLLECAALLHDVGRYVAVPEHHKHTYYLLKAERLDGLSEAEQRIVATVARYHRKSTPSTEHEGYGEMNANERSIVSKLAALLRLADALDAQLTGKVQRLTASTKGDQLGLRIRGEGELLMEQWLLVQKGALLKDVLGLKVKLSQEKVAHAK